MAERWISVSDEEPKGPDWVLVATASRRVFPAYRHSEAGWCVADLIPVEVTHWMPFPAAPGWADDGKRPEAREVSYGRSVYTVERNGSKVTIYDGGDELLEIMDPADDCAFDGVVVIALAAYYAGRADGKIGGRAELQYALRRLIGAAAAEVAGG